MPVAETPPALAVVLHDVAPATWPLYRPFLAALQWPSPVRCSLLVVPDYHGQGRIEHDRNFRREMDRRLAAGDELVLHGYRHRDEGPSPAGPAAWLLRRVYTREAEFWTLEAGEATRRLQDGIAAFRRCGWPCTGFVAPAWLCGPGTRAALHQTGLAYTTSRDRILTLGDGQWHRAPSLVWSARSRWRRVASRAWNAVRLARTPPGALLRLGLHPTDMRHASVRDWWLRTLHHLLHHRIPVTKTEWLRRAGARLQPPRP